MNILFQEVEKQNASLFWKKMHHSHLAWLKWINFRNYFRAFKEWSDPVFIPMMQLWTTWSIWIIGSNCLHFFEADMNHNPFFFFSDIVYEPLFIRVNACVIIVAQSISNEENVRCINSLSETSDHKRVHKSINSQIESNDFDRCIVVQILKDSSNIFLLNLISWLQHRDLITIHRLYYIP